MPSSTLLRWTVQSLVPQLVLRRSARAGQLGAKLTIDRELWPDPFPVYEQMRAQGPLLTGGMIWSTTSHAVAGEILRSPAFRVGVGSPERLSAPARWIMSLAHDPWAIGPAEPPSMLAVDPPDHTRYRRLVSKVFTARAVAAMEPDVERIADQLLDEMARKARAGEPVDLVESYAGPLPVTVIAGILGVPEDRRDDMLDWGNSTAVTLDPALRYRQFRTAQKALRQIHRMLAQHLERLRREPGDDLLSKLAVLVDEGETLNDVELRATALLVIGAGFETTVNLIANGVTQLLDHPDQLAWLRENPAGWGNAVDEVLRFDSPVQATVRVAGEDTELPTGQVVPAGTFVSTMLGGANRDPEVFADPQRFDVRRDNAREHLAFSSGIHFCLGASLARLEGAVALRKLFERFPDLSVAGTPVRREMRVLRGYEHLPVRVPARPRAARPRTA